MAGWDGDDESQGDIEIRFCTSDEDCEKAVIDSKFPIIAENQQPLQWKSDELPIKETFDQWRHDEDLMVYVQPSSRPRLKESYEKRTIREVAEKFLTDGTPKDPWNLLKNIELRMDKSNNKKFKARIAIGTGQESTYWKRLRSKVLL
uniref:Uncharacterized protein n=1 Tax=Fusarium oxysporum (strain Fo5176) TaxID=660025 RepID=A0A0D2YD95_FUSOF